jgi:hypothetical protein
MVQVPTAPGPTVQQTSTQLSNPLSARQSAAGATPDAFGAGVARAQQGAAGDLNQIGKHVSDAALKIQMRKNARDRMKAYLGYQTQAADLHRGFLETGDLTDDAQVAQYHQQLNEIRSQAVGGHGGGPLSSLDLDNQLVEAQSGYSTKMNEEVFKAHRAIEDNAINALAGELTAKAAINPSDVQDLIAYGDNVVKNNWGDALPPEKLQIWQRSVRSAVFEGAIENMLAARDSDAVYDLFDDNPDLGQILGADKSKALLRKARAIELGTDKDDTNVNVKLEKEEALAKGLGEGMADIMIETVNKGRLAMQRQAAIEGQNNILETGLIVPGPFFEARTAIAQVGKFFGMESETLVKMRLGDPDAARAFQAKTHEQTVEIVQAGSRITNMFIGEVRGMMPQLWMTPGGIAVIQEMRSRIAEFETAEGQVAEKYAEAVTTGPIPGDEENSPGYFTEIRELKDAHKLAWEEAEIEKRIKEATDKAPNNWEEAAQELRGSVTQQINPEAPTLTQQIQSIGATDEQAFVALGQIGQQLGMDVKLMGIDPVSGRALLSAEGREDLLRTPKPFIEYMTQPEPAQAPDIGDLEEIEDTDETGSEAPNEDPDTDPF